ncbi:DEAD/DEAH box helicase [Dissulfurirhabdus thermomarina]|uniref:DEAD/DEAH box helicase n=1 Tax=Dissulfurirhabdus thermomarina TaxID=1765737 RepID=A0A6N9TMZ2_DISTH|nr:DEAD/DEAH box helicase [Dissulfurirhabdus thermomarina]NDY42615.1 DEAD/DEAH box helicase [Dissulfurirhabdus thermomarina]NMX24072.1 DEAD/DEAH box helicase [Dissulfurirhabdus thermomarina]
MDQHLTDIPFTDLDLEPILLRALDDAGFTHCTPIQAKALPIALAGRGVAGQAQTGTGKTAAFLLATFQHLIRHPLPPEKGRHPRALILAPTRELAIQIHRDAEALGRYTDFRMALVYGGTGYDQQRETLRNGTDVVIGTPGRLIDYLKQKVYRLDYVQVVVIDEADRMFDLGFIADIRYLLRRTPPPEQRLNMMFSATLSLRVTELAYEHLASPEVVKVEAEHVTADQVRQVLYHVAMEEKIPLLLGLLRRARPTRALIFVNTKRAAERVRAYLRANGHEAAVLSGDIPQNKRQRLLERFSAGEIPLMVATDVAARGLHIPEVSHVFNFDLPQDAEDYVHRIGRTGRIGASGEAISLACEQYVFSLPDIEEYIGEKIPVAPVEADLLVTPKRPERTTRARRAEGGRGRGQGRGGAPRARKDGRGRRRPRAR